MLTFSVLKKRLSGLGRTQVLVVAMRVVVVAVVAVVEVVVVVVVVMVVVVVVMLVVVVGIHLHRYIRWGRRPERYSLLSFGSVVLPNRD